MAIAELAVGDGFWGCMAASDAEAPERTQTPTSSPGYLQFPEVEPRDDGREKEVEKSEAGREESKGAANVFSRVGSPTIAYIETLVSFHMDLKASPPSSPFPHGRWKL